MERIIENCAIKHTFHFINGAFSRKFYEMTKELKKDPHYVMQVLLDGTKKTLQVAEQTMSQVRRAMKLDYI